MDSQSYPSSCLVLSRSESLERVISVLGRKLVMVPCCFLLNQSHPERSKLFDYSTDLLVLVGSRSRWVKDELDQTILEAILSQPVLRLITGAIEELLAEITTEVDSGKTPNGTAEGICWLVTNNVVPKVHKLIADPDRDYSGVIHITMALLRLLFLGWEHHSRDNDYPVYDESDSNSPHKQYNNNDKALWDQSTLYGRRRVELLQYTYARVKEINSSEKVVSLFSGTF